MRTNPIKIVIFALAALLCGCASSNPSLVTFATESGATQYFFPMMEWKGEKTNTVSAVCDVTYRYEPGAQGVCNITFAYTKGKNPAVPPLPSALSLIGGGISYDIRDISLLFSNVEKKQTRITAVINGDDFLAALRSDSLTLTALIDGTEYRYTPSGKFLSYRDKFLADIAGKVY
jgi:hypothetical protein